LIAGTLYHWADGLHHFSEHMRHRRRVHELEAEVAELRAHLDTMLEMPDHSAARSTQRKEPTKSLPAAEELPVDFDPLEAEPLPEEPNSASCAKPGERSQEVSLSAEAGGARQGNGRG